MSHIHEKIDFTVGVYIVYQDKVLLRMHEKYHIWLPPGGHIELDEDPNEAAIREVKEEVGLDVELWNGNQKLSYQDDKERELIPPISLSRQQISPTHEHLDHLYFGTSKTDVVVPESPTDEWRWLKKDELDSLDLIPS